MACEKDKEFALTTLSINNEVITPAYNSADVRCSFKTDATISDAYVQYALSSSFAKYDVAKMTEEKGIYAAQLVGLADNTTYYIRYEVSNKYSSVVTEEVKEFQTLQCTVPTIVLDTITDVVDSHAKVQIHLTFDGGASVTDMGVCWSTQANPTTKDIHVSTEDTLAVIDITSLQSNTKYYVRAYAVNKVGVAYSEEKEFTTLALPEVRTEDVSDIQVNSALLSATLVFDGNDTATIKGFCWSDKSEPTIEGDHIAIDTASAGYTYALTALLPETQYFVRAYAQNKIGIVYGDEVSFTTKEQAYPSDGTENGYAYVDLGLSVKWATINVGASKAEDYGDYFAWGEVEPKDYYDWSTYKYCNGSETTLTKYNTSSSYGTVDNKTQLELSDDAARANWGGNWRMPTDAEWIELREQCTWTWTTQNGVYGRTVTSKTNGNSIFLPAAGSHDGSSLTDAGSCGRYWSSSLGSGSPNYAWYLTFNSGSVGRRLQNRYNGFSVRPVLGESVVETTIPTVTTTIPTQITETSAVAGGNVTSDGGASVSERGVVYSLSANPSIADLSSTIVRSGSGTGAFTCNLSNLQAGTTYYVRAYAINNKGTAYGDEVSFTTAVPITLATVTTASITNITETTAKAGGTVTNDGNASVTERGVVYSTNENPTIANNKLTNGSGTGSFTCNLTGLQANTTYYVRAYAVNSKGTAYGEEVYFTTEGSLSDPMGTENGYGYVDLGLSVKWATYNVGANKPEDYGDYFAWGETTTKSTYEWSTYKYCNGSATTLTKYCNKSSYGNNGFTDNKTQLELSDDAARVNWGGSWRMPTDVEWTELREQCTWTWTTQNGVYGRKVTSKTNGNSIFFPATGCRIGSGLYDAGSYGDYWSSSLNSDNPSDAWYVFFDSGYVSRGKSNRAYGFCVRPVLGESIVETTIPTVTTTIPTQITETTAVAGGNVTSDGGASVTERGVVYGKSPNPTISNLSNTIRPCGSGMGEFTYNMTDLQSSTTYYVRAYATNEKGTAYGEEVIFTTKEQSSIPSNGTENGHEYVDLGLSVKWATCNVGASSPEEYGDYFAWGETEPKDYYEYSTYKWCNGSSTTLTKYNTSSSNGIVDNKTQLELSDDAAYINWGGAWRMPTDAEMIELREQCTWTWVIEKGVNGYMVISKSNNNMIFIPAAGFYRGSSGYSQTSEGYYWSCSLRNSNSSYELRFDSYNVNMHYYGRFIGHTVRPVCP